MKYILIILLAVTIYGCQNDNPAASEQTQLPEIPFVIVTQSNYSETDIQSRVPDTTFKNKCCSQYGNNYTASSKKHVITVLMQKAQLLNQDTSIVSGCLNATGQLADGIISIPYFVERAKYQSKECLIMEFAWGLTVNDLNHYRCFVMEISTRDTLLFITCK